MRVQDRTTTLVELTRTGGALNDVATKATLRNAGLDAVRIVGITAVVVGHSWNVDEVGRWVYPWHVPLFFFLTGYLFKSSRPFVVELRARTRSLAYPYVFWILTLGLLYAISLARAARLDPDSAEMVLWGGSVAYRPFTTFWFFSVLFFTSLLARVVWRLPRLLRWACAIIGITLGFLFGDQLAAAPLSIGSALPCLFFIVAGAELRAVRPLLIRAAWWGTTCLILAATLIGLGVAPAMNVKGGDYGTPLSALLALVTCAGLVLLGEALFTRVSPRFSRAVTALAVPGLIVVLLHPVVLWVLDVPDVASAWQFAAVLVLPWTAGLVAVRGRFPQFVTGIASVRR